MHRADDDVGLRAGARDLAGDVAVWAERVERSPFEVLVRLEGEAEQRDAQPAAFEDHRHRGRFVRLPQANHAHALLIERSDRGAERAGTVLQDVVVRDVDRGEPRPFQPHRPVGRSAHLERPDVSRPKAVVAERRFQIAEDQIGAGKQRCAVLERIERPAAAGFCQACRDAATHAHRMIAEADVANRRDGHGPGVGRHHWPRRCRRRS